MKCIIAGVFSVWFGMAVFASAEPIEVRIDCGKKVAESTEPMRFGTCTNFLLDSDSYDPDRKVKIRESLKRMGVKAIRWSEGEVGDKVIWSIPPFETPDIHVTHRRTPGTVHYTDKNVDENGKIITRPMELDEVIAVARDLRLELFIIIGTDAIWVEDPSVWARNSAGEACEEGEIHKRMTDYPWAIKGKTAREMITLGAEALARYLARHAADLDVFIEIGNENYLGETRWKPECYAEMVNQLSRKIKAINPKLRVGAQVNDQRPWVSVAADGRAWNEVMRTDLDLGTLDHIIVHQYGYKDTRNVDSAVAFLESLPEKDRKRLTITVTELGTWYLPGYKKSKRKNEKERRWSENDLRSVLYQLRWLGMIWQNGKGKISTPLFWTTRWLNVLREGAYAKTYNALTLDGELTPNGEVIRIWNRFAHDSLVEVTVPESAKDLYCYASQSLTDPDRLTVWLVNNDEKSRDVSLDLMHYPGNKITAMWQYHGTGPEDRHPVLTPVSDLPAFASKGSPALQYTLEPYTITIFQFDRQGKP